MTWGVPDRKRAPPPRKNGGGGSGGNGECPTVCGAVTVVCNGVRCSGSGAFGDALLPVALSVSCDSFGIFRLKNRVAPVDSPLFSIWTFWSWYRCFLEFFSKLFLPLEGGVVLVDLCFFLPL